MAKTLQTKPADGSARLLVIRFSSFGDIVQATSVPAAFRRHFPEARVDWLVRRDLKGLLEAHPALDRVLAFERRDGLAGLLPLAWRLGGENYTHIYDAHNNVRSKIVVGVLGTRRFFRLFTGVAWPHILTRSKDRIRRFLFFRLRKRSALPMPFRGVISFLKPLEAWGIDARPPDGAQFFLNPPARAEARQALAGFEPDVALIPSAAWEMKRWPVSHWLRLIELLPDLRFVVLGGPEDSFCADLEARAPDRVRNLAGKLSLQGSGAVLEAATVTVSADTGLLHVADQMNRPVLALIGPTAFGYPSRSTSEVLEIELPCKPCSKDGRGKCVNSVYQRCMIEITPERVAAKLRDRLNRRRIASDLGDRT